MDSEKLDELYSAAAKARAERTNSEFARDLTNKELELKKAFDSGVTSSRGAVGQSFGRSPAAKSPEYLKLSSYADKQAFRQAWVAKQWAAVVEKRQKVKRYSQVDSTRGVYMCFKRVLELEGGCPRAATLYCSKCLKMGKPWILYNTMTER
eukprot:5230970-Alexandrium_andersonii.AAC.1